MLKHGISLANIRKGVRNPRQAIDATALELLYRVPSTFLNTKTTIGENVFNRVWDLLILLDTCRVDAMKKMEKEFGFINATDELFSVGARSPEWIAKTFSEDYARDIEKTAYLSANAFSKQVLIDRYPAEVSLSGSNFAFKLLSRIPTVDVETLGRFEYLYEYEPVGEDGPIGHKEGGTPPRYVTDRGIAIGREHDYDRVILHYLQPHPPYIANALKEDRDLKRFETDWWGYLGETGDRASIWDAYLDELRFVLDDVQLLLNNFDAERVAISADHGESFGEYWEFGHRTGSLNPMVRKVPWVETTATDQGTYESQFDPPGEKSQEDVTEQLEALGYKV